MKTLIQKYLPLIAASFTAANICVPLPALAAPRANAAWGTVPSPNGGFGPNQLFDVEVLSATDIWAVGDSGDFVAPSPQVHHFDGSSWKVVPLPAGTETGDLIGVSAVSANDVWFAGGAANTGKAFLFHWDGTAITRSTYPSPGSFNRLYDVVALAADNVWAVGEYANGGVSMTLIEHWNGTTWTVVPSPTSNGEYTQLLGISAVSASDIWSVGTAGSKTYSLHWDGSSWQKVSSPQNASSSFLAVSANAAGEVWAVGKMLGGTLTARWTGTAWQVIPSPAPGGFTNQLTGVVVLAANNVWASGYYDAAGKTKTLALHWDGTLWTQVASVSPDPSYNTFNAIDADSSANLWAVGRGEGTLTERLSGATFAVIASANADTAANDLKSISANAPNDIWAVGKAGDDPVTIHWDGISFALVPTPDLAQDASLEGVKAIAANDVWAVGGTGSPSSLNSSTVTEHWNGSVWAVVASPNPGRSFEDMLYDVDAAASNDVWAVGDHSLPSGEVLATILHWNGSTWSEVANSCGGTLRGVTVIAPNDIWAVGATACHYDGATWTQFPIPPTGGTITLQDVSAVAPDDVWAVGQSVFCDSFTCYFSPYAIHWDGSQWRQTPVPPTATLAGVQAIASNNVVAVGTFSLGTEIIRWNGRVWQTVPSPDPESGGALNEITLAGKKLWSVGSFFTRENEELSLVVNSPSDTQGAITGATGVADATVAWFGAVNGSTTTDAFGNYAAAGLPAGTYTFVATADGCDPDIATVTIVAGKTARQNFSIDCGG